MVYRVVSMFRVKRLTPAKQPVYFAMLPLSAIFVAAAPTDPAEGIGLILDRQSPARRFRQAPGALSALVSRPMESRSVRLAGVIKSARLRSW